MSCRSGKRSYSTYAEALAALVRVDDEGLGSVYECVKCGEFHISSRRFTLEKRRGRGKGRRGIVFRWTA